LGRRAPVGGEQGQGHYGGFARAGRRFEHGPRASGQRGQQLGQGRNYGQVGERREDKGSGHFFE